MQLIPYFQPIVDISNARVVGHESLARMIDSEGKVRSAAAVFTDPNLKEEQILSLDRQLREDALKRFAAAGQPGFLTLNITPRWIDILDNDCVPTIEMLAKYKINPSKVVVEIIETESYTDKLYEIARQYKKHGVRVAVDDFGAGSSQFDRVVGLAPDIIKLDMEIFKQAMRGGSARNIVLSLSYLAEKMGSQVLCEGVEDYSELRFALEIGSKLIQGYMFSPAQAEFTQADKFSQNIAIQRKRFLLESMRKEEQAVEESQRISHQIDVLCELLQGKKEPVVADLAGLDCRSVLGLFICDLGGTQVSATWRQHGGRWVPFTETIGTNWCWRPYFCQLLSYPDAMQEKSVTSRHYHDAHTGELVKTRASFIGNGRVLMVDIKVRPDTVL